MSYRITLKASDEAENELTIGEGLTFSEAAIDLLINLNACYGSIAPEVFEGLASFQDGDVTDEPFEHRDFSCPEDQFDLTCEVT